MRVKEWRSLLLQQTMSLQTLVNLGKVVCTCILHLNDLIPSILCIPRNNNKIAIIFYLGNNRISICHTTHAIFSDTS